MTTREGAETMARDYRYRVRIKRYHMLVTTVSEHYSLCAAGRMLGSFISGKRRPRDLEQAYVLDIRIPAPETLEGTGTVRQSLAIYTRRDILAVCHT